MCIRDRLEAGKGIIAEDAGHLTGAVGAEVHEDNGVAVLHTATLAGDAGPVSYTHLVRGLYLGVDGLVFLFVDETGEVLCIQSETHSDVYKRQILNTCPEVLHYTGIWTDTLRGGATQLINTNKLLRRYEGILSLIHI